MNIKKMKLALAVELINQTQISHPVEFARKAMQKFCSEAGDFRKLMVKKRRRLDDSTEQRTLALVFDYCTLDLALVKNRFSKNQFVQGFELRMN